MTAIVTRGDAGNLHLPDETVDLIVTSPPYFGLRSYQDGGVHYAEQIGAEATPAEYLDALMACTAEWMRVLKPGGSIFVNLGDKYATGATPGRQSASTTMTGGAHKGVSNVVPRKLREGVAAKSLVGLPWRYAIRCIDELGLILRAEIVWAKPNGLPESVTDRVRRSHEQVFHFVKQPRYYSAVDEVREAYAPGTAERYAAGYKANGRSAAGQQSTPSIPVGVENLGTNPLGKLPGSVWTIPTAPLRVPEWLHIDHFAAYPPELVRRIVLGWSPREVCTACGEGRRPVSKRDPIDPRFLASNSRQETHGRLAERGVSTSSILRTGLQSGQSPATRITGYACACPDTDAPATPGVVLDPFGGTGTTALVASVHGRIGISNDLSDDYCRLAQWRTTDEKQRAKAAGKKPKAPKKKPEPVADVLTLPIPDGQLDLLDGEAS